MNKLVELNSVKKAYRNGAYELVVLGNVSLFFSAGDFLSIVGPSGAGKSTLLHVMGGLEPPNDGSVLFQGKELYKMKDKELARWRNKTVGFVFQFYHLIEELNILENIVIPSFANKTKSSFQKARELLKYLGIEERESFFPSQLSGGEKQKAAIARALINDPEIILCDEPTGNLDKDSQEKVVQLLDKLNRERGKTIILVTHNLELAQKAKRTLFLKEGKIIKDSTFNRCAEISGH